MNFSILCARRLGQRLFSLILGCAASALAAESKVVSELPYKEGATLTAAEAERCRLDLYLPSDGKVFAALLWLHGGGMTGGSRSSAATQRMARRLAEAGIVVGSASYRLNPTVKFPAYIDDAAAAFAWLRKNIGRHGGDPEKVFIGGHSAGAYLALMVALDDRYLAAQGLDEKALAGVVALSGQTITHFTVRAERHPGDGRIRIDDAAPLFHVRKRPFPILLYYAEKDMAMRVEENRLLAAALREAKCEHVVERLWEGRDHGTIFSKMGEATDPVSAQVIEFLRTAERSVARRP